MTTAVSTPDPATNQRAPFTWEYRRGEWLPLAGGILGEPTRRDIDDEFLEAGFGEARPLGTLAGVTLKVRTAFGDEAKWHCVIEADAGEDGDGLGEIAVADFPSLLMLIHELGIRRPPQQRAAEVERRRKADRDEDY